MAGGGVAYLAYALQTPAAAIVAGLTFVLYVAVYTPLKRVTTWNTVVGAVPGALPPVIGWCAANGTQVAEGWVLFAILFVWQLPHFYSIAWLYRDDYARGGAFGLADSYHFRLRTAPLGRAGSPLPAALNGAYGVHALPLATMLFQTVNVIVRRHGLQLHHLQWPSSSGDPPSWLQILDEEPIIART